MKPTDPAKLFTAYLALGIQRSYARVARDAGLSKAYVAALAKREDWQQRIAAIETQRRRAADRDAVERMTEERLATLRSKGAAFSKKLEFIAEHAIRSGAEALDLLELGWAVETCLNGHRDDLAERLLDLYILRGVRSGSITPARAAKLLWRPGEAA